MTSTFSLGLVKRINLHVTNQHIPLNTNEGMAYLLFLLTMTKTMQIIPKIIPAPASNENTTDTGIGTDTISMSATPSYGT